MSNEKNETISLIKEEKNNWEWLSCYTRCKNNYDYE